MVVVSGRQLHLAHPRVGAPAGSLHCVRSMNRKLPLYSLICLLLVPATIGAAASLTGSTAEITVTPDPTRIALMLDATQIGAITDDALTVVSGSTYSFTVD